VILARCLLYLWYIFEVPYKHVLQLRARFVLQAINIYCNSIKQLQTLDLKSLRDLFCAYPRSLPLTLLERVICVFEIGVGLVLVFVGFGLFQICSHLPFSPHSKDHTLQRSLTPPLTPHPCAEPFKDANKRPTSLVAGERPRGGCWWWARLLWDIKHKY